MPSLRSSIRKRLEAEEAEQNPQTHNPIEEAAKQAIEERLAEQPEPVLAQQPDQPGPLQRMAEARAEASPTTSTSLSYKPRMPQRGSRGTNSARSPISLTSKTDSDRKT